MTQKNLSSLALHFFDEGSVRVGEDVPLVASQRAARNVEVYPQVGVVSFYGHTDVLQEKDDLESRIKL